MNYFGTRLSENISRREPEGYLLCLNVPVARSGTQEYLPEELGLTGEEGMISVMRPVEEVFAAETMASFEGMPVTNDHPSDGVDIENIRRVQAGHAHNIRRGAGEESDLLLADLIITDPGLIDAILNGKREISCGYTYELHEENGQYIQRKIRGNHIAVVDAGRAGPRVSIRDHKQNERKVSGMKKSLSKILARMAKDGDIETVAEIIEEMIGEETDPSGNAGETAAEGIRENGKESGTEDPAVEIITEEGNQVTVDEDAMAAIIERLDRLAAINEKMDRLIALITGAEDEDPEDLPEAAAEAIEETLEAIEAEEGTAVTPEAAEEVSEIIQEILEPEVFLTPEEGMEDEEEEAERCQSGQDLAIRTALKLTQPVLKQLPRSKRKRACVDLIAEMKGMRATDAGVYAALAKITKPRKDPKDLGRKIMESRNVNYQK